MCDVKKYEKIYEEIKCLEPEDTLQLTFFASKKAKTGTCEEFILNEKIYCFGWS